VSEYCPWVKIDYRVHALTPAVGRWAFSPSERYLAWVEGPEMRAVHVTELDSMRTVCTLEGVGLLALAWVDGEVLRVVRAAAREVIASRHAVPDGGSLGVATMPRDSLAMSAQTSADGRVTLVRQERFRQAQHTSRAFLIGWRGEDEVTELSLHDPRPPRGPYVQPQVDCALAPDGHRVGIVFHESPLGNPLVLFVTAGGGWMAEVPLSRVNVRALGWVSPTALLLHVGATLVCAELDGTSAHVAQLSGVTALDGLDLHPERDQLLLRGLRPADGARYRTVALRVRLDGARLEVVALSGDRSPEPSAYDGGACWDRDGAIVTLTQSPPGVANLMRRPTVAAASVRLAHFKLIGERPVDLALAPSPRRERFVMTWRAFDRGPADPVRRLALFAP